MKRETFRNSGIQENYTIYETSRKYWDLIWQKGMMCVSVKFYLSLCMTLLINYPTADFSLLRRLSTFSFLLCNPVFVVAPQWTTDSSPVQVRLCFSLFLLSQTEKSRTMATTDVRCWMLLQYRTSYSTLGLQLSEWPRLWGQRDLLLWHLCPGCAP